MYRSLLKSITGQGHTGVPCEKYCYLGLLLSLFGSLF